MLKRTPHRLKGSIIKLRRRIALYQTHASPYYFARILDRRTGAYKVRSTKETSRVEACRLIEELAQKISRKDAACSPGVQLQDLRSRAGSKGPGE